MRLVPLALLALFTFAAWSCSASSERGDFGGEDATVNDSSAPVGDAGALEPGFGNDASSSVDAAECTEDIDVVFALDVSSTMSFVLDKLDAEIQRVVDAANGIKAGAHFGIVFFVDNTLLDTSGDQQDGKVHTQAATLQTAFRYAKSVYTARDSNPGDGPDGRRRQNPLCEENSLDALYDAVHEFPWRDNAARLVIVATDDTFLERPDNYGDGNGDGDVTDTFPFTEGDYPARTTVAETVEALRSNRTRVFSFTRLEANASRGTCGTSRRLPGKASVAKGWSVPYGEHAPIPETTGGRNLDLDLVRSGSLSLADSINDLVLESHCSPIVN